MKKDENISIIEKKININSFLENEYANFLKAKREFEYRGENWNGEKQIIQNLVNIFDKNFSFDIEKIKKLKPFNEFKDEWNAIIFDKLWSYLNNYGNNNYDIDFYQNNAEDRNIYFLQFINEIIFYKLKIENLILYNDENVSIEIDFNNFVHMEALKNLKNELKIILKQNENKKSIEYINLEEKVANLTNKLNSLQKEFSKKNREELAKAIIDLVPFIGKKMSSFFSITKNIIQWKKEKHVEQIEFQKYQF